MRFLCGRFALTNKITERICETNKIFWLYKCDHEALKLKKLKKNEDGDSLGPLK